MWEWDDISTNSKGCALVMAYFIIGLVIAFFVFRAIYSG